MFSREARIIHRQVRNLSDMIHLGELKNVSLRDAVAFLLRKHRLVGYTNQELMDGLTSFRFSMPGSLSKKPNN